MKKTVHALTFLLIAGLSSNAFAQKLDASKVPAQVKAGFAKKFPEVDKVKWEKEGGAYEAGFKENDQTMSALFTPEGVLTETEVSIPVNSLPPAVLNYLRTNHKGVAVKEAARITKANGEVNYEAEVKGSDLLFDAGGKYLKTVKD